MDTKSNVTIQNKFDYLKCVERWKSRILPEMKNISSLVNLPLKIEIEDIKLSSNAAYFMLKEDSGGIDAIRTVVSRIIASEEEDLTSTSGKLYYMKIYHGKTHTKPNN